MNSYLTYLNSTELYYSNIVFFGYCLAVSNRQRNSKSWSGSETLAFPLGSLISILIVNFGSAILLAAFKGAGLVEIFKNDTNVFIVMFAWWIIYFSPSDYCYFLINVPIITSGLNVMIAWTTARRISEGVDDGQSLSEGIILPILFGVIYGFGGSITHPLEAALRGKVIRSDLHQPSLYFLVIVFISILSTLLLPIPGNYSSHLAIATSSVLKKKNINYFPVDWLTIDRIMFQNIALLLLMTLSLYIDFSKVLDSSKQQKVASSKKLKKQQ